MKTFSSNNSITAFTPALKGEYSVAPKEEFVVLTKDCFSGQIKNESTYWSHIDATKANCATGPIEVQGAKVGQVLKIHILDIEVDNCGTMLLVPGSGVLGHMVKREYCKKISVENDYCNFSGINLKSNPMIGVIGVATKKDVVSTVDPGQHGGNMDTKEISKGSILYLPIAQPGAMLALGDVHALMSDGELSCSGLEIGAKVRLKVELLDSLNIKWPLLENDVEIMTLSSAKTFEDAMRFATEQMVTLLSSSYNITWEEAYLMCGLILDLRIAQVVNSLITIKAALSKEHLSILKRS